MCTCVCATQVNFSYLDNTCIYSATNQIILMCTEWVPKLFSLKIYEKQAANHRCQGCDNEVQDVKAISFKVF